jgi:L-threonylcarbamoyladenylate synthase
MKIIDLLNQGKVVILPTDTVYGLFCKASDINAVKKIYKIKGRDFSKPLQVFFSNKKDIYKYCELNIKQKKYICKYLPGPYTFILKIKHRYKSLFPFLKETIGVRLIKYKFLNNIIKNTGPLAATSANISGEKTPVKFDDISKKILKKVSFFIKDDSLVSGKSSKVIDLTGDKILILRK